MREFIVGTGGKNHTAINAALAMSEVRNTDTFGVLKPTLRSGSYEWQFVLLPGSSFTDSGSGKCHGKPAVASISAPAEAPLPADLSPLMRFCRPTANGRDERSADNRCNVRTPGQGARQFTHGPLGFVSYRQAGFAVTAN